MYILIQNISYTLDRFITEYDRQLPSLLLDGVYHYTVVTMIYHFYH